MGKWGVGACKKGNPTFDPVWRVQKTGGGSAEGAKDFHFCPLWMEIATVTFDPKKGVFE